MAMPPIVFPCLLKYKPTTRSVCASANCTRCGWYEPEAERRRKAFAKKGLTLCPDGLKRFVEKPEAYKEVKRDVLISY